MKGYSGSGQPRFSRLEKYLAMVLLILALAALLALQIREVRASETCDKAKEYYDSGVKLLNWGERKDAFAKAVELCPTYAEAHVNLADAFEKLGEFELAEKHYYEAIALGLKSTIPFLGLGELFLKTGRYSLAVESFQKGVAIDSANEALQDGLKVATERIKREKVFFTSEQMKSCLVEDEQFRLMCMCPVDYYSFLRKWICMPVIAFSPGSGNLTGEARRQLDAVAEVQKMKELDSWTWLITGHADSMGESNRNTRISKDRAESVKRYLVNRHAIDAQKLRVVFFGQDRPCGSNSSLEGRAENRRVEIVPESP